MQKVLACMQWEAYLKDRYQKVFDLPADLLTLFLFRTLWATSVTPSSHSKLRPISILWIFCTGQNMPTAAFSGMFPMLCRPSLWRFSPKSSAVPARSSEPKSSGIAENSSRFCSPSYSTFPSFSSILGKSSSAFLQSPKWKTDFTISLAWRAALWIQRERSERQEINTTGQNWDLGRSFIRQMQPMRLAMVMSLLEDLTILSQLLAWLRTRAWRHKFQTVADLQNCFVSAKYCLSKSVLQTILDDERKWCLTERALLNGA